VEKEAHVEAVVKEVFRNPKGLAKWQKNETSCGVKSISKRHTPYL